MEILAIIIAFSGAALAGVFSKRRVLIEISSVIASLVVLITISAIVFRAVARPGGYQPLPFFFVDSLAAIVLLIIGSIGLAAMVYSVQYFRQETEKGIIGLTRVRQYFALVNLFLLAMCLAVAAGSPIFAWIATEATTLATAFLISFYNKPSAMEAAWKYLIINSVGLLLGFFGTLLYFTAVSSLGGKEFVSWELLMVNVDRLDPLIAKIAFIFVLIGYGTKIGFVPMHTWKPDAYGKAPAPLGALVSGALFPVAFVLMLKFKIMTDAVVGAEFSRNLLIVFGLLSIAVSALIMFNAKNYKRLLAYSSIENAGIMALGFGFGGLGVFAAILHLIYHSGVKAIMFFSAGNLLLKYNSTKILNVKGALGIIPATSVLFISGILIVTGTPPFGIFLTKMYILSAGLAAHPAVVIAALFFMAIVFIGFLKHLTAMFFGDAPAEIASGEGSVWLVIPPLVFLVLTIGLSFYLPPFLLALINDAATRY